MPSFSMIGSGAVQVIFDPEWNYERQDEKMESVHRTRSGNQYRYVWGNYKKVKFDLTYITSDTAATLNAWWLSNTPVVLYDASSVVVCSGYITNKKLPMGSYNRPYQDQYSGTIELESY